MISHAEFRGAEESCGKRRVEPEAAGTIPRTAFPGDGRRTAYFPRQKRPKTLSITSSDETCPVRRPMAARAGRSSSANSSARKPPAKVRVAPARLSRISSRISFCRRCRTASGSPRRLAPNVRWISVRKAAMLSPQRAETAMAGAAGRRERIVRGSNRTGRSFLLNTKSAFLSGNDPARVRSAPEAGREESKTKMTPSAAAASARPRRMPSRSTDVRPGPGRRYRPGGRRRL